VSKLRKHRKLSSQKKISSPAAASCVSPPSWEIHGLETNELGFIEHHIFYDLPAKFVRWDRYGNLENRTTLAQLITITNYTSEIEYLINQDFRTCLEYGPDAIYPWGYGNGGMMYVGESKIGGKTILEWENPTNGFRWTADSQCLPFVHYSQHSSTVFFNARVGPIPPSVFQRPSFCKGQK